MDLREHKISDEQINQAAELACKGLMCYQPFQFSDDLMTGAGYEFAKIAEGAGLVYAKEIPDGIDPNNEAVQRHLIDPCILPEFKDFNRRLDVLYQSMIDLTLQHVGKPEDLTFADVGCCSGYFPLVFSQRGAKEAVGFDREDYSRTFNLLNDILGTNADFQNKPYRGDIGEIENAGIFDVVCSIAVLVHLSDPLSHLAFLGRSARKAILVWTWTSEDQEEDMTISYKSINRYYEHQQFPFCFDVMQISPTLLRRSLELMGFTEIYELENCPDGMPGYWFERHRGFLGVRPENDTSHDFTPGQNKAHKFVSTPLVKTPHLIETIGSYNLVSFGGIYWGIPHSAGEIDFNADDLKQVKGMLHDVSLNAVRSQLKKL